MCGRFSLTATRQEVEALFEAMVDDFPPRYNIAPTQPILTILSGDALAPGGSLPSRMGHLVRWGFIPAWVKNPRDVSLIFNIRSETAMEKNSFRAALTYRRALVPASGFYEWRREGKKRAQAYWVRPRHGGLIAFAGLMESWLGADGSQIDTGAILTTSANATLKPIHERMPVVIDPIDFEPWLDCRHNPPPDVARLLRPAEPDFFEAIPVSDKVNRVSNVSPDIQDPAQEGLTGEAGPPKEEPENIQLSMF
ncbi:SOS response-associated peptidase [Brucella sp. IR073]|uniref:SOS response-associated peptidase n=1 Tax=unclassified Brucella TaxID=2632610 RepID=UPI003B983A45